MYYLQSRYYNPTWGRFINADALVSTGQGIIGNNMFAYCNNNSVNAKDPDGHALMYVSFRDDPMLNMFFGGGGGGGGGYAFAGFSSAKDKIKKFEEYVTNESEATAKQNLKGHGMSFYKGVPIFAVDAMEYGALSFGIILMGSDNLGHSDFSDTLNHEYGHYVHMTQIGVATYTVTTAIPSLIGAGLTNAGMYPRECYFDLPWERTADYLGGVNRQYLQGTNALASIFWLGTLLYSRATP